MSGRRSRSDPRLRSRSWPSFLHAPDPQLLNEFYVPALACAVRYDRCCAYFSSSVLAAAARGFGCLIERLEAMGDAAPRPAIRLLVNEELSAEDVRALSERGDAGPLEKVLGKRFKRAEEALEKKRLQMLAWLVKRGLLEVRVGVMRGAGGVLHAKYGVITDSRGDTLVFSGSGNESAQGLIANYEVLEITPSWLAKARNEHYRREFDTLWEDRHPHVLTVPLPEAIRRKLVKLAPKTRPTVEPSAEIARLRAATVWRWLAEAPYMENGGDVCDSTAMVEMWPHQRHVVRETAEAWPEGRLLCDEVGMGKTLEAILVMRRLLAGRGVRRVLILVPANLTKQWQAELREKGGIIVPRLDGDTLIWPDGTEEKKVSLADALKRQLLLMSRETARKPLYLPELHRAEPWDLVVLDEAHAARRAESKEREFNVGNQLLNLVRELSHRAKARGLLFLSATPMQINPWEPWDLLQPLGVGDPWLADFEDVRRYYDGIRRLERNQATSADEDRISSMVAADSDFPAPDGETDWRDPKTLRDAIAYGSAEVRSKVAKWLRSGSPLSRCLHRNTRRTLRGYYAKGLLDREPPKRVVRDVVWDFGDDRERTVYENITSYIDRRFAETRAEEQTGKGFVMAVYRRRAASSLAALKESLLRRKELIGRYLRQETGGADLEQDLPEGEDRSDLPDEVADRLSPSVPTSVSAAKSEGSEIEGLLRSIDDLSGTDSKLYRFVAVLDEVTADGRACLVFTEYLDTMLYLREQLLPKYGTSHDIATYSGKGGSWWDGEQWQEVSRSEVARKLSDGELRVVICTDAASEGLNLQAASALINYDLPYNPSKVEQRIGRIDRIGQRQSEVIVTNLFLKESVDERVYTLLQQRCGMFREFIGPMQPVLGEARSLLLGQSDDVGKLEAAIRDVQDDELMLASYREAEAADLPSRQPALEAEDLRAALTLLGDVPGYRVIMRDGGSSCVLRGPGRKKWSLGLRLEALERDLSLVPLNPSDPTMRRIADSLGQDLGESPLVIGSVEQGGFRASTMVWVDDTGSREIRSARELLHLVRQWDGTQPSPAALTLARRRAHEASNERVTRMLKEAGERQRKMRDRQVAAARARLAFDLCRTLGALTGSFSLTAIHNKMHEEMQKDGTRASTLKKALELLGGYPDLPLHHQKRLEEYVARLTSDQRETAVTFMMVEAALRDPRWEAAKAACHE